MPHGKAISTKMVFLRVSFNRPGRPHTVEVFRVSAMPKTSPRLRSLIGGLCLAGSLAACAPVIDQRGNLPGEDKLATIRPGVTGKDAVAQLLGTPSTKGTFDDRTWYYISKRTEQMAFFEPTLLDQQVVAIDFDDNGMVSDIRHLGMEDRRDVTPVARQTPAAGRELTIVEQLLGNVGRFNTNSDKNKVPGNTGGGY
jgi:outer membrane protein assembly factor BamE (lipoprotein component of BamABCDE complex)